MNAPSLGPRIESGAEQLRVEAGNKAAVKTETDSYKAPKAVIVATELPKTSTGKIQKNVVRQTYRDHYDT